MKLRGLSAVDILALMAFWGQVQNVLIQSSVEIAVPYMLIHEANETSVMAAVVSNATVARLNFDGFRCKEKEGDSRSMHFYNIFLLVDS